MAIIAVDFDGTIVEHRYPEIGKEVPFATDTLRMLINDQHRLILWTVREGKTGANACPVNLRVLDALSRLRAKSGYSLLIVLLCQMNCQFRER